MLTGNEVSLVYGLVNATMIENPGTGEDDGRASTMLQLTGGSGVETRANWLHRMVVDALPDADSSGQSVFQPP
jgi:hypothetical protein